MDISVTRFRASCLALIRRVEAEGEPVDIKRRGKVVARLAAPPTAGGVPAKAWERIWNLTPAYPPGTASRYSDMGHVEPDRYDYAEFDRYFAAILDVDPTALMVGTDLPNARDFLDKAKRETPEELRDLHITVGNQKIMAEVIKEGLRDAFERKGWT